eukprot:4251302-Pyramimonas_sp.AAC.2
MQNHEAMGSEASSPTHAYLYLVSSHTHRCRVLTFFWVSRQPKSTSRPKKPPRWLEDGLRGRQKDLKTVPEALKMAQ